MIVARSVLFNIMFVLNNAAWFFLAFIPTFFIPRRHFFRLVLHPWCASNLWLHRVICNVTVEIRGAEHMPTGGAIVAAKHQSAWETLALARSVPAPSFIIKRQLMYVPMFGFYLWWAKQTPINRGDRTSAMAAMNAAARRTTSGGGQLMIFPEGTRRPIGAEPAYKFGVAHLYEACGVPCVPVALNAGVIWPRRTFLKYPGKIIMEFFPAIPPGLPKDEFFERMKSTIEDGTKRLVAEVGVESD
jgi:1-acyl-sn-glycerol-3-phosphate acyltransferase